MFGFVFKNFFLGLCMMAEYHPLIACSISFVLCFCVYANFSCTVCYEMFKLKKNKKGTSI